MDFRILSIGSLSKHPLWGEAQPVRTAHSTCTLIRSGDKIIVVDPGLPAPVLAARLFERSGLRPEAVTDVFLTHFRPAHRMGLAAFPRARGWMAERERETIGHALLERFQQETSPEARQLLQEDIQLLRRLEAAEDCLAPHVDLFPLPGYTPGTCGLLLSLPRSNVLIASDAVPTAEHLEQAQILPGAWDLKTAMESFREAIEIADWIIPGHDNLLPNPTRRPF